MSDPLSDPSEPAAAGLNETRMPSPAPAPRRWWRRWKLIVLLVVATPVALFVLYTVLVLNVSYSTGQRSGFLQKLSNKGWVCKTWEGELAVTTQPGIAPEIWLFTVRNDAAARQLGIGIGRRVVLFYREHRGVPLKCFGDTRYFVDSIHIVK